nr:nidogen-like [Lepeophtheirus salmonis]
MKELYIKSTLLLKSPNLILLLTSTLFGLTQSLSESELVPFGRSYGDQSLPKDVEDISSPELELDVNVKFFGREYGSIFVNENGLVSFLTEIPVFFNLQFPMEYPLIAALYSDVDTRAPNGGTVWFRKTHEQRLLDDIGGRISIKFGGRFRPRELFVTTWDHVGCFDSQSDELNTYQIVIASDENDSYVLLLYPENGIQWVKGKGKTQGVPDATAQAGIISGEGQYVEMPFSGKDQVRHMAKWSNVNEPGVFMYKTGRLEPSRPAVLPDVAEYNRYSPNDFRTCSEGGSSTCHLFSQCNDLGPKYCCKCNPTYVGNGESCIQLGTPQRVIGTVSLNVNSVDLRDQDLHCYIVTEEGRSYTAFSRIDASIANELQSLSVIGTPAGWLFAQSINGAPNGFTFTGGVFNYTAKVTFPNTNHEVTVTFNFKGLDVFDYINADVHIEGGLPRLGPEGIKIVIEDFDEKFTKERPGLFTSSSKRKIILESGNRQIIPMNVEQRITFEECDGNSGIREIKLHSGRNFVVFDEAEGIVRFALTNKVTPFEAQGDDSCMEVDCGINGKCEVQGSIGVCICNSGYEFHENQCIDINECLREGMSNCSPFAECINDPGSYGCLCKSGYLGNGELCFLETSCEELNCGPNSECITDDYGIPKCSCLNGFNGNGSYCYSVPSEVELRGYANPETIALNLVDGSRDINVMEDIGPPIHHFYEILNHGPYTIGDLKLRITWPLRDLNGRYILYIPSAPFIKYSNQGDNFIEQCQVDSSIVNPEGYQSAKRVKRQDDQSMYDDYNDLDKLGMLNYEQDYSELDDYDYSHFDTYNKDPYVLSPSNEQDFQNYDDNDSLEYNDYTDQEDHGHAKINNNNNQDDHYRDSYNSGASLSSEQDPFYHDEESRYSMHNDPNAQHPDQDQRYPYDPTENQNLDTSDQDTRYSYGEINNPNMYPPRQPGQDYRYGEHGERNPSKHDSYDRNSDSPSSRREQNSRYGDNGEINNQNVHPSEYDSNDPNHDPYAQRHDQDPRYGDHGQMNNQNEHDSNQRNYDPYARRHEQDPRYSDHGEMNNQNEHDLNQRTHDSYGRRPEQDPRYGDHGQSYNPNKYSSEHDSNDRNHDPYARRPEQDPRYGDHGQMNNQHEHDSNQRNHDPYARHPEQDPRYGDHGEMNNQNENDLNQRNHDPYARHPEQDPRYGDHGQSYNPNKYSSEHDSNDRNHDPYARRPEQDPRYRDHQESNSQNVHSSEHDSQDQNNDPYNRRPDQDPRYSPSQMNNQNSHSSINDPRYSHGPRNNVNTDASAQDPRYNHQSQYNEPNINSEDESSRRQGGPGQVSFICNINLAVNEIASLTVKSYLDLKTLSDHYPEVTQFVFPSEGEVVLEHNVKSKGSNIVNLLTTGVPRVKVDSEDAICGELQCHKNADCYQTFRGDEAAQCRCKPGFKGDGFNCIDSGQKDCRIDPEICHDFGRCEYDMENEFYHCQCLQGYEGNGTHCERVKGSCQILNDCSKHGNCALEGSDFVCRCLEGYQGDGYNCERISNESWVDVSTSNQKPSEVPTCMFETCSCYSGYIFEGSRCIIDESRRTFRVPVAHGYCFGNNCECPRGYKYDKYDEICKLEEINFPSADVFCDDNGIQCSQDANCIYDRSYDHSLCVCNDNYIGDGFECELSPVTILEGKCSKDSDCSLDMKCVIVMEEFNYKYMCIDEKPNEELDSYTLASETTVAPEVEEYAANKNLCSSHLDCHADADCIYNTEHQRYQCECFQFYEGDGKYECFPSPDAGCDILENCDSKNGVCSYEDEKFVCRCKPGFHGDGITCREDVIGCNVINNCGQFATCQFDFEEGATAVNVMNIGFRGDGFVCNITSSCSEIPSICHARAECVKNAYNEEYHCECTDNFIGDGLHCEVIPEHDGNFIFMAHGMALMKVPFSASKSNPAMPIFIGAGEMATGIDVDCITGKVYWTDTVGKRIRRSNYDGTQVETFLEGEMEFPIGIAIDFKSRNLYWTDSGKRSINIANMDTKNRRILIEEFLKNPRGIALHPTIGVLLWTDWDRKHPKIELSNMDGTDRRTLVDTDLGMPNSITVNYEEYKFCWTDGGSTFPPISPKIECLGIHGGGSREVLTSLNSERDLPYGICHNKDDIYWTDWKQPLIQTINSKNLSMGLPLHHVLAGMGKPFGMVSVPEKCPYVTSTCKSGTCDDNKICAPNGRGGATCLCQDGDNSQGCNVEPLY